MCEEGGWASSVSWLLGSRMSLVYVSEDDVDWFIGRSGTGATLAPRTSAEGTNDVMLH